MPKIKLTEQEKLEGLNKLMKTMLEIEPLVEFKEPKNDIDAQQKYSLAQCYKDKGFREYLENAINQQTKYAATNGVDIVDRVHHQARVILLKELLVVCKNCYKELENVKIKSKAVMNGSYDGRTFIQEEINAVDQKG